jgi:hypothetical protein
MSLAAPPWSVDDPDMKLGQHCFAVRDANGQRSGRSPGPGRAPSTVSREISRNRGSQTYRASRADGVPGSGRYAPSLVVWHSIESYDGAWRRSSRSSGRRRRSMALSTSVRCLRSMFWRLRSNRDVTLLLSRICTGYEHCAFRGGDPSAQAISPRPRRCR